MFAIVMAMRIIKSSCETTNLCLCVHVLSFFQVQASLAKATAQQSEAKINDSFSSLQLTSKFPTLPSHDRAGGVTVLNRSKIFPSIKHKNLQTPSLCLTNSSLQVCQQTKHCSAFFVRTKEWKCEYRNSSQWKLNERRTKLNIKRNILLNVFRISASRWKVYQMYYIQIPSLSPSISVR